MKYFDYINLPKEEQMTVNPKQIFEWVKTNTMPYVTFNQYLETVGVEKPEVIKSELDEWNNNKLSSKRTYEDIKTNHCNYKDFLYRIDYLKNTKIIYGMRYKVKE